MEFQASRLVNPVNRFKAYPHCCNPYELEGHAKIIGSRKITQTLIQKKACLKIGEQICHNCRLRVLKEDEKGSLATAKLSSKCYFFQLKIFVVKLIRIIFFSKSGKAS